MGRLARYNSCEITWSSLAGFKKSAFKAFKGRGGGGRVGTQIFSYFREPWKCDTQGMQFYTHFIVECHRSVLFSMSQVVPLDHSDGWQPPQVEQQFSSTIHLDSNWAENGSWKQNDPRTEVWRQVIYYTSALVRSRPCISAVKENKWKGKGDPEQCFPANFFSWHTQPSRLSFF